MPNATQILRNGSRLLGTRDALLAGQDAGALTVLRAEITQSWLRSMAHGVEPGRLSVPYTETAEFDRVLRLAADPVAEALADDLTGTNVSLLLSDDDGRIVDRRIPDPRMRDVLDRLCLAPGFHCGEESVGTTAISIALNERGAALVAAGEHYADVMTPLVCAAAPVIDPRTGQVLGTIGLASPAREASPLMIALVRRAAHDVELRFADGAAGEPRGEVADWEIPGWRGGVPGWDSEVPGWGSLTPAQQSVAEVIAEGVTNREAAARLYLSRHTIDFHLRQIFRKLGIASRVELTRLVVARDARAVRD